MGIPQARILEWVPIPSSKGSSQPRDRTQIEPPRKPKNTGMGSWGTSQSRNWTRVSWITGGFFTSWATQKAQRGRYGCMGLESNSSLPCGRWFSGKESACQAGDTSLILTSGKSPGEENGNPLQYSCLGNSMARGAWWARVYRVAEGWTQLSDWAMHQKTFRAEIRNEALCALGKTGRTGIQIIRYFQEKILRTQFLISSHKH